MGVHGNRRMAESGIKYNVRGLAADSGQRFQQGSIFGDLTVVFVD